ncbi:MAG: hypothetical protein ACO1NW_15110 [Chitinophagaceae bacterium]
MRIRLEEATLRLITDELIRMLGKEHIQPSDCKLLSNEIVRKTGNLVSETTLKRLFGFAKRNFNFSLYTLDTLALYSGHKHWDNFYSAKRPPASPDDAAWEALRKHALQHSYYTLRTIQHASGIPFQQTAVRRAFLQYIDKFLKSGKKIAPIVAPSGFGKSIALAQCVLRKWLGENAAFPEDICCMLNADQLASINQSKSTLNDWFSHVLAQENKFQPEAARKHSGKLIIVIDGFDERTFPPEKLRTIGSALMNFIHAHAGFDWIRIIVALRPSAWESIFQSFMSDTVRRNLIFLDHTQPESDYLNHTLPLDPRDIRQTLLAQGCTREEVACIPPQVLKFLSFPRYFDLYCQLYKETGMLPRNKRALYVITAKHIRKKFSSGSIPAITNPESELSQLHIYHPHRSAALKDHYLIKDVHEKNATYPTQSFRFTHPLIEGFFTSWQLAEKHAASSPVFRHQEILSTAYGPAQQKTMFLWLLHEYLEANDSEAIMELMQEHELPQAFRSEGFLFLLSEHPQLASMIDQRHHITKQLFESGAFLYLIPNRYHSILEDLLKINTKEDETESLLLTLFMSAMMQLDIPRSEYWLLRFRQATQGKDEVFQQLAEKLMAEAVELAQYGPMDGFYIHSTKALVPALELLLQQAPYKAYMLVLISAHLLMFSKENALLTRLMHTIRQIRPQEPHAFSAADTFLELLFSFAGCNEISAVKVPEEHSRNIFHKIMLQLVQAARYLNNGKTDASIQQAALARCMSHKVCLPAYTLLSRELLKTATQVQLLQGKIRS